MSTNDTKTDADERQRHQDRRLAAGHTAFAKAMLRRGCGVAAAFDAGIIAIAEAMLTEPEPAPTLFDTRTSSNDGPVSGSINAMLYWVAEKCISEQLGLGDGTAVPLSAADLAGLNVLLRDPTWAAQTMVAGNARLTHLDPTAANGRTCEGTFQLTFENGCQPTYGFAVADRVLSVWQA